MANDAKDGGGWEVRVIAVDGPMPSRRFKSSSVHEIVWGMQLGRRIFSTRPTTVVHLVLVLAVWWVVVRKSKADEFLLKMPPERKAWGAGAAVTIIETH